MLARLSLCLALAAALGGCASYPSRYDGDTVVYRDGDYYVPADADRGDYYYAPDEYDASPGYPDFAPWAPSLGFAGFDGYCPIAYAGCLPWWAGGPFDPSVRFWFGYGGYQVYAPGYGGYWYLWRGWGVPPYRHWDYRDHRHDRDRDHDRGRDETRPGRPGPVAAPGPMTPPAPDLSRPAPVERMPRPVFGGRLKDPFPEPMPSRPPPGDPAERLAPAPAPEPSPDEGRLRWRGSRVDAPPSVTPSPLPSRTPVAPPAPPRWREPAAPITSAPAWPRDTGERDAPPTAEPTRPRRLRGIPSPP